MMKKCFPIIFWSLFTVLLYAGGKEEVQIGYLGNLSGRGSELWVHGRNGIELAVDRYNQGEGHYRIDLHVIDTLGEEALAREGIEELLAEGVKFFFGPTTSAHASSVEDYFLNQDILFFSATASSDEFGNNVDSLFRVIGSAISQGEMLARLASERERDRSYIAVYDHSNLNYAVQVLRGFQEGMDESGALDVLQYNGQIPNDFMKVVPEILEKEPEALILIGTDLDVAGIMQQIYKKNGKIHFYTSSWANTEDFVMNAGRAAEGSYQIGSFDYDSDNPDYVAFRKRYEEVYGIEPLFTASRYFDLTEIFIQALDKLNHWDVERVKEILLMEGPYTTFQGPISFNEYGDAYTPYINLQIIEGKQVVIP